MHKKRSSYDKAVAIATSFEVADPTVDSQILTLANTKADVLLIYSVTPRACAQALRRANEIGWKPMRFISSGCANKESVMVPAGLEAATGVMSVGAIKPYSPDGNDPAMAEYNNLMKTRLPNRSQRSRITVRLHVGPNAGACFAAMRK